MMRKTKIVCTIGPATDDDDIMKPIRNGMNKLSGYGKNLDCRLQL